MTCPQVNSPCQVLGTGPPKQVGETAGQRQPPHGGQVGPRRPGQVETVGRRLRRRALVRQDAAAEQSDFVQTGPGVWATVVPVEDVQEYYELDVRLRWAGLDLRVVDETVAESGEAAVMAMSLQHDYRLNEGLQLVKLDADWYEAMLPKSALGSAEFRQTMLPTWPGADTTVA